MGHGYRLNRYIGYMSSHEVNKYIIIWAYTVNICISKAFTIYYPRHNAMIEVYRYYTRACLCLIIIRRIAYIIDWYTMNIPVITNKTTSTWSHWIGDMPFMVPITRSGEWPLLYVYIAWALVTSVWLMADCAKTVSLSLLRFVCVCVNQHTHT